MKKIWVLLTSFMVIVSSLSGITASAQLQSVEEQAAVLVKMGLLQGSGDGIHLTDTLSRAQAAALIVRLLGQEELVLKDGSLKNNHSLSDVNSDDWYAQYVNYCYSKQIIDGFPDGTFKPNDPVSEKAFIKLVLVVLGNRYATDFQWESVYRYARQIGLMTEEKTTDTINYPRSGAVAVLFKSLTTANKLTGKQLVESFIAQGKLSQQDAIATGLAQESTIQLSEVKAINNDTIQITFSDKVKDIVADQIRVYDSTTPQTALKATVTEKTDKDLKVKVEGLVPNKEFAVELSHIEDQKGALKLKLTGKFNGYQASEVKSSLFKISKVEAKTRRVIEVTFTQPITSNLELPSLFELQNNGTTFVKGDFNTMTVHKVQNQPNVLQFYLVNKSLDAKSYSLKISGDAMSLYGVKLGNGSGDQYSFIGSDNGGEQLSVTSVYPVDTKTLQIIVNKEMDEASSTNANNYSVTSGEFPLFVSKAAVSTDGKQSKILLALDNELQPNQTYEVALFGVQDSLRQFTLSNTKYKFIGNSTAAKPISIMNVTAEDQGTVRVYFDKRLNQQSVSDVSLYSITGAGQSITPISVYFNPERPNEVKLFLPSNEKLTTSEYSLTVAGALTDELGVMSGEVMTKTFKGSSTNYILPSFTQAQIIGSNAILVKTNKEIYMNAPNNMASSFSLQYESGGSTTSLHPTSVNLISPTTLVFLFDSIPSTAKLSIKISQLMDYSGQYTRNAGDDSSSVGVSPAY